MGIAILIFSVLLLLVSYRYYATRRVNQTVKPEWSRSTPARRKMDGVNFIPSPPGILAGFQFKSISLDVIIGPVIAVQFGWLAAILWLLFGAIFFGWVLDYFSTIIPIRSSGSPIGDLIGEFFNPKSRKFILIFLYVYLLIILGQFGLLLSTLIGRENVVSGILILVFAGFIAGLMIYRWRVNLYITTFISFLIALIGIWTTTSTSIQNIIQSLNQNLSVIASLTLPAYLNPSEISWQSFFWLFILFATCYLIAVLPMWQIAVPLNYVSSWLVIFTLGIAVAGLLFGTLTGSVDSTLELPPLVTTFHPNLGPIWPILFVTLSSGAVSGWHSLVSSYSTSRQIEKEPFVLPITTGSMFAETVMVIIVIIFAASYGVSSGIFNPDQNFSLTAGPASILAVGLARSWNAIGLPESFGGSLSAMFLTMLGITILHLALRFSGMVAVDLFDKRFKLLSDQKFGLIFIILLAMIIILFGFWQSLWILFAGANQLLAAIVLLLASAWLVKLEKSYLWTLVPSIILFVTALAALLYTAVYQALYRQLVLDQLNNPGTIPGNFITIIFGLFFMIFCIYIFTVGMQQLNRYRTNRG
jgi:carbon starvation protein